MTFKIGPLCATNIGENCTGNACCCLLGVSFTSDAFYPASLINFGIPRITTANTNIKEEYK